MVSHILEKRVFLFQANVISLVNSIPENLIFNRVRFSYCSLYLERQNYCCVVDVFH